MCNLRHLVAIGRNMKIIKSPVELLTVFAMKADSLGRAGPPADEAALEQSLQIEHQIEITGAHPGQKRANVFPPVPPFKENDFVDRAIALKQGKARQLDGPCQESPRKCSANHGGHRQCPRHVSDGAVQHDQNSFGSESSRLRRHNNNLKTLSKTQR